MSKALRSLDEVNFTIICFSKKFNDRIGQMEKLSWFRTEYGIFVEKEIKMIFSNVMSQVHLDGGCSPVPAASSCHHNSLLPYLSLPEGRWRTWL